MRLLGLSALLIPALTSGFAFGEPKGLAAKYPGDSGLAHDSLVVFYEDFESKNLPEIFQRFDNTLNTAGMRYSDKVPGFSQGRQSLEMTSVAGKNEGGHLYKVFPAGYSDSLFLRYYIRYAGGGTYHHTGGRLGGYNPVSKWPLGLAGKRPAGNANFSVAFEPLNDSKRLDFYNYWMGMRSWTEPPSTYYGNRFIQNAALQIKSDEWMCVEFMIKMNNPLSVSSGELALWIDGEKVIHLGPGYPQGIWKKDNFFPDSTGKGFEGFRWRSDAKLNINWLLLQHYVTGDPAGHTGRVYYDHVVVAREYIGPLAKEAVPTSRGRQSPADASESLGTNPVRGAATRVFQWMGNIFQADGKKYE